MWFFKRNKDTQQETLIKKIKEESLDMSGLFSSISNRDKLELLYKELCKLSHPDRNPHKREIAQELFTKVQQSRNDFNSLMELKTIIIDTLIEE